MECSICIETYNSGARKQITCAYCSQSLCMTCCEQYLLTDTSLEPNCAHCRAVWNPDFIVANFTVAFRTGAFKAHREKVLFDREKARLPETQDHARKYKEAMKFIEPYEAQKEPHLARMKELGDSLMKLRKSGQRYSGAAHDLEEQILIEKRTISKINATTRIKREIIQNYGAGTHADVFNARGDKPKPEERKQFVRRCPAAGCEGFLSTQWKCGLCSQKVCKECHEIKKELTAADHHCDPVLVASIKAIAEEAKPCPKCAAVISKIDGCDQMWCTQCKTAFSWKTGKIETSHIHNPHYFQWMRENGMAIGGGAAAGRGCNDWAMLQEFFYGRNTPYHGMFDDLEKLTRDVQGAQYDDQAYRIRDEIDEYQNDEWRRICRVKRLVGEYDDKAWQIKLQREEKAYNKNRARLQLLEMYVNASRDILNSIIANPTRPQAEEIKKQLTTLRGFVETENDKICEAYQCVPIHCLASEATKKKYMDKRAGTKKPAVAPANAGAGKPATA